MTSMFRNRQTAISGAAAVALALIAGVTVTARSQDGAKPAGKSAMVDPALLQPLLPAPPGWTTSRQKSEKILVPECSYSFAEATFTKEAMTIRLTVADTASSSDALLALATMIVTLPDDFIGDVPPSTTIKRLTFNGSPAAERWNAGDGEGEFAVLVNKRFVVKAEGTKVDSADTLRAMVEAVDLKKVANLK